MIRLIKDDNRNALNKLIEEQVDANLIYADCIYESLEFDWIDQCKLLLTNNGIMIVQTDYHSVAETKIYLDHVFGKGNFVNWLIWKNEFGNFRKDRFRQCHDDILIYAKSKDYKWYPDRVQVPKATANSKGLNKSGRMTKLATSVITDICLTTIAKERIKKEDGHNVRWQKPVELLRRLFIPFLDAGDLIVDPYAGTGSSAIIARELNCNYIGIENDSEIFDLALERMNSGTK
jgi:DNA modification methylase